MPGKSSVMSTKRGRTNLKVYKEPSWQLETIGVDLNFRACFNQNQMSLTSISLAIHLILLMVIF